MIYQVSLIARNYHYFFGGLVVITSCSKKGDPALIQTQLLTQHAWVLNAFTSTDPTLQSLDTLLIGTEWKFNADKSFTLSVKVNGATSTVDGAWDFTSDEKKIVLSASISGSSSSGVIDIVSLTTTVLELKEVQGSITNQYTFRNKYADWLASDFDSADRIIFGCVFT